MTPPTIHINGTSSEMLLEGYCEARLAVVAARNALAKVEFNARDYYVKPGTWEKACAERAEMFASLAKVEHELESIAEAILEQCEGKNR